VSLPGVNSSFALTIVAASIGIGILTICVGGLPATMPIIGTIITTFGSVGGSSVLLASKKR